jgi:hypothetical protein
LFICFNPRPVYPHRNQGVNKEINTLKVHSNQRK